jgi:diguanylate cyclase (GGDEF)-like protein
VDDVWRRAVRPTLFLVAYVATAKAAESLTLDSGFSPWYPPAGLVLAYLLAVGPRAAPTVFVVRLVNVAILVPDAWRDEPEGVIARAVAITACYTAAAVVLRRVGLHHVRLRELGWFATVGVVGAPLGGSVAVALVDITLLGNTAADAFDAAFTFWVGDAIAVASIVPAAMLLLASTRGLVRPPRLPSGGIARLEAALQAAALILVPVLALAVSREQGDTAYLVLALVPAVWVALRRDLVLASIGLLVLTASLSIAASLEYGPTLELSELQAVLLSSALAALYIAAATHGQEVALADLVESEQRFRSLVRSAPDLVARLTLDGQVRFASEPPWVAAAGGTDAVLTGLRERWPAVGDVVRSVEWEAEGSDGHHAFAARLAPERLADGTLAGVVAVVTDLTPRRRAELERDHARVADALTGLCNRIGLREELDMWDATNGSHPTAVVVVDLDGLKAVNLALGHDRGDDLLRQMAARLVAAVPEPLVAARVGGDEFAVATVVDPAEASALGEQVVTRLRTPVRLGELYHVVTASVGVAVTDGTDGSSWDTYCDADSAMHAAKEAGRDRSVVFDAARRSATEERRTAESLLRRRLAEEAVLVHYQPIVDLVSGAVVGVEALVRLRGDDGAIVFPGAFVPVAEDAGLDVELGSLVLDRALGQLARWNGGHVAGRAPLALHVNVTARQLTRAGFVEEVLRLCVQHRVAPAQLTLELTETLLMAEPEAAVAALARLREAGVGAALDDFGTGYSSIAYLSQLPVSALKIDRAFVDGLPDEPQARAVVGLVAGLGAALDLDVTAEGIETDEQRATVVALGCLHGQGFLLARPAPAEDLAEVLRSGVEPSGFR